MLQIPHVSGEKVIDAEYFVSLDEERVRKMRAKKTCGAGDHDTARFRRCVHLGVRFRVQFESGGCGGCKLGGSAPNAQIKEAMLVHDFPPVEITPIDDDWIPKQTLDARQIERAKLLPIG